MLKLFVPTKAPSHRQERVAEEVRFLLCQQLQRDSLPIERDEDDNLLDKTINKIISNLKKNSESDNKKNISFNPTNTQISSREISWIPKINSESDTESDSDSSSDELKVQENKEQNEKHKHV